LGSGASTTCTVTISRAAPAGGSLVSLSSNNALLPVPGSVLVSANATTASFNATGGTISTDQSATVTATLNGGSQTASVSLIAPATVSALSCNPGSLGSGASTSCTVTLNKPAPAGGSLVGLSSNNGLLPVVGSVLVAANGATATFNATAGTIPSDQSATI